MVLFRRRVCVVSAGHLLFRQNRNTLPSSFCSNFINRIYIPCTCFDSRPFLYCVTLCNVCFLQSLPLQKVFLVFGTFTWKNTVAHKLTLCTVAHSLTLCTVAHCLTVYNSTQSDCVHSTVARYIFIKNANWVGTSYMLLK